MKNRNDNKTQDHKERNINMLSDPRLKTMGMQQLICCDTCEQHDSYFVDKRKASVAETNDDKILQNYLVITLMEINDVDLHFRARVKLFGGKILHSLKANNKHTDWKSSIQPHLLVENLPCITESKSNN